jgi:hypothetical protein
MTRMLVPSGPDIRRNLVPSVYHATPKMRDTARSDAFSTEIRREFVAVCRKKMTAQIIKNLRSGKVQRIRQTNA